jgi:hypothetical protein
MLSNELQNKLMDEIRLIPEARWAEVFDFIHFFRLGVEAAANPPADDAVAAFRGRGQGGATARLLADRQSDQKHER